MKLQVPLMIPAIHSMRFADRPSRIALMIGMPPATEASKATITPLACALAKISVPCLARSALLAVTTCLPASSAFSTSSSALVSPPISSTTMSMSGRVTIDSAEGAISIPSSETLRSFFGSRAAATLMTISRPARRAISSRLRRSTSIVPLPTVPRPRSPTCIGFILARFLFAKLCPTFAPSPFGRGLGRGSSQFLREMEGGDGQLLAEVELVRLLALRARVERKGVAVALAPDLLHVGDERVADAGRAAGLVGHEIVAVELAPAEGLLQHAKHGDAGDVARDDRHRHFGAAREYLFHARGVVLGQVRAQLAVHTLGGGEHVEVDDRAARIGHRDDVRHGKRNRRDARRSRKRTL